jgi:hypothetical protein
MCIVHWISAKRRLKEAEKTVTMLRDDKYSDRGVPEMVLAQRDFIKKEVEYFEDECVNLAFKVVISFLVFALVFAIYMGYKGTL